MLCGLSKRRLRYHSFFFNDTPTAEIYTLSLHDALPIFRVKADPSAMWARGISVDDLAAAVKNGTSYTGGQVVQDRKSTRLNSSHVEISYAVFCLKKKNN